MSNPYDAYFKQQKRPQIYMTLLNKYLHQSRYICIRNKMIFFEAILIDYKNINEY